MAACRSGVRQGGARFSSISTCRLGWVRPKPQGFPHARASGRPVWGKQRELSPVRTPVSLLTAYAPAKPPALQVIHPLVDNIGNTLAAPRQHARRAPPQPPPEGLLPAVQRKGCLKGLFVRAKPEEGKPLTDSTQYNRPPSDDRTRHAFTSPLRCALSDTS